MKLHARLVLDDCRDALTDLHDKLKGGEWRRRWAAAVGLLRTVGYVLDKVDAKSSLELRAAVDAKWAALKKSKPEPAIFWGFIEDERNWIVHEYAPRAGQGITIPVSNPDQSVTSYRMNEGLFAGRDPRDIVRIAVEWWDNYLKEIEAEVATQAQQGR
jgi:hypothetical protein